MTNKQLIEHIKLTNKFPKTFDDYMNYLIFIFPIAFICIGLAMIYSYLIFEDELIVLIVSMIILVLGSLLAFFTFKRLNETITFESLKTIQNYDVDRIAEKLKDSFKLRSIDVDKDLGLVIAHTSITLFSWGEKLTLVTNGDTILINSRPSGITQPVTIIKDRLNIKKIKQILN